MKTHPVARHARHLYKVSARAADMFGQLGNVMSSSPRAAQHTTLLMLETVGRLHKEIVSWRRHLAVIAVRGGLSQRAVADALQVSRRTVQIWLEENDRSQTKPDPRSGRRDEAETE